MHVAFDACEVLVEIQRPFGIDLHLSVISRDNEQRILHFAANFLIKKLVYGCKEGLDSLLEWFGTWSVIVTEGIDTVKVEIIVVGRSFMGDDNFREEGKRIIKLFEGDNLRSLIESLPRALRDFP